MICAGSIMVQSIAVNQILLPLNLILENAYATHAELITVPNVETPATISEFLKNVPNEMPPKPDQPLTKFSQRHTPGIRLRPPFNISVLFLNAPLIIHNTGYIIMNPKPQIRT